MKYCKDCKWHDGFDRLPYCLSPKKVPWDVNDPVKGRIKEYVIEFCMHQREDYSFTETCGKEGKWWEPKPPKVTAAERVDGWARGFVNWFQRAPKP
jgi:hypothetical protein